MTENDRIRREYRRRDADPALRDRYAATRPEMQFTLYQRRLRLLKMLRQSGILPLSDRRILDIGAGAGGELRNLAELGAEPGNLTGIDLMPNRLKTARKLSPTFGWCEADGLQLPFSDGSFDIVMQWTVFSSVLLPEARMALAHEMIRVLHPKGIIIWYDILTATDSTVLVGLPPSAVKSLFPGCQINARRVTLHWSLARHLAGISWELAGLIERLIVLNTHLLAVIAPTSAQHSIVV
jgi:SAM-dependent methyltransferase